MDLGCYPLHWLRSFMGQEPEILSAHAELTSLKVDQRMEVAMGFAGGVEAQLVADIASPPFRDCFGSRARRARSRSTTLPAAQGTFHRNGSGTATASSR